MAPGLAVKALDDSANRKRGIIRDDNLVVLSLLRDLNA